MDSRLYDQFLMMKDTIDNRRVSDDKMNEYNFKLDKQGSKTDKLTAIMKNMKDHNQNYNTFPENMDSSKSHYPTTMVLDNKEAPPFEAGNYMKFVCMWNLKHEFISPNLYELLIKADLIWT